MKDLWQDLRQILPEFKDNRNIPQSQFLSDIFGLSCVEDKPQLCPIYQPESGLQAPKA